MRMLKLAALALGLSSCALTPRIDAEYSTQPAPTRVTAPGVALSPLIDARPASGRRPHTAGMSSFWGLAAVYFAFGSGRLDGIMQPGDKYTYFKVNGRKGDVPSLLDAYVKDVIGGATGSPPAAAPAVELTNVRAAAAGRADGITIVPILDQFDAFSMSSVDSIAGGSSYQDGNYQVTKSGSSTGTAYTGYYGNLRLRLVLLETRGGQVVRQATAYVATSGSGSTGLSTAMTAGAAVITKQLAGFVTRPELAPTPTPSAPSAPPPTISAPAPALSAPQ